MAGLRSLVCSVLLGISVFGALIAAPRSAHAQTATRETSLVAVLLLAEDRNQSVFKLLFSPRTGPYEITSVEAASPGLLLKRAGRSSDPPGAARPRSSAGRRRV